MNLDKQFIFYLIGRDRSFTTSEYISKKLRISPRSVKTIIKESRDNFIDFGGEINSVPSKGYKIDVIDDRLFEKSMKRFAIRYYYYDLPFDYASYRQTEIMRKIIFKDGYFSLNDLMFEMFTSSSEFRNDFSKAIQELKKFNIFVRSYPEGFKVEGSEFSKRLCAVELLEIHYHKGFDENDEYYEEIGNLDFDIILRSQIRQIFLKHIRSTQYRLVDTFCQRFSMYLTISLMRIDKLNIEFDKNTILEIESSDFYNLSKKILISIEEEFNLKHNKNEAIAFAILLYSNMDYLGHNEVEMLSSTNENDHKSTLQLTNNFKEFIFTTFNIDLPIDVFIDCFYGSLHSIVLKTRFKKYVFQNVSGSIIEKSEIKSSFLAMEIAHSFLHSQKNIVSTDYDALILATRINYFLSEVKLDEHKLNIIITARSGNMVGRTIKNEILDKYRHFKFGALDVLNLYEIRPVEKNYDLVLFAFPKYSYNYELPFLEINQSLTQDDFKNIEEQVINNRYKYEKFVSKYNLKLKLKTNVKSNQINKSEYTTKSNTLNKITSLDGADLDHPNIYFKIAKIKDINLIEIIKIDTNKNNIQFYITLSINFNNDLQLLKTINIFLNKFVANNQFRNYIYQENNIESIFKNMHKY